jgi:hypothetical protein
MMWIKLKKAGRLGKVGDVVQCWDDVGKVKVEKGHAVCVEQPKAHAKKFGVMKTKVIKPGTVTHNKTAV